MIEQLVSELEEMIRKIEASGIDTGIDISRLKEITLSIKNGSRYVTMDELQAVIGKVQEEITEVRKEVGDLRTEVNNLDKNLSKEIAGVRTDLERALREQTVRIITIVGVMLGIVVAAISVVATVIGLFG